MCDGTKNVGIFSDIQLQLDHSKQGHNVVRGFNSGLRASKSLCQCDSYQ